MAISISKLGSLRRTAACALGLVGDEEDLHLRFGATTLPMSPFGSNVSRRTEPALALAHDSHLRMPRYHGHETVDLRVPDRRGHVLVVDGDLAVCRKRDLVVPRQLPERTAVLERHSVPPREPGERAVHRTRVQVPEAETLGERGRDGALPRPGRSVDGDDHAGGG